MNIEIKRFFSKTYFYSDHFTSCNLDYFYKNISDITIKNDTLILYDESKEYSVDVPFNRKKDINKINEIIEHINNFKQNYKDTCNDKYYFEIKLSNGIFKADSTYISYDYDHEYNLISYKNIVDLELTKPHKTNKLKKIYLTFKDELHNKKYSIELYEQQYNDFYDFVKCANYFIKRERNKKYLSFNVNGVSFRQDVIKKYVKSCSYNLLKNDDYSKTKRQMIDDYDYNEYIYQYLPLNVKYFKFEEEPANPHDKNAIKILISSDDIEFYHVGYVPMIDNSELKELLHTDIELIVECLICGGKYKMLNDYDEIVKGTDDYYIKIKIEYTKAD